MDLINSKPVTRWAHWAFLWETLVRVLCLLPPWSATFRPSFAMLCLEDEGQHRGLENLSVHFTVFFLNWMGTLSFPAPGPQSWPFLKTTALFLRYWAWSLQMENGSLASWYGKRTSSKVWAVSLFYTRLFSSSVPPASLSSSLSINQSVSWLSCGQLRISRLSHFSSFSASRI